MDLVPLLLHHNLTVAVHQASLLLMPLLQEQLLRLQQPVRLLLLVRLPEKLLPLVKQLLPVLLLLPPQELLLSQQELHRTSQAPRVADLPLLPVQDQEMASL